jgi:outer membrane protein OmpA-like peptidoglycan-associated protein
MRYWSFLVLVLFVLFRANFTLAQDKELTLKTTVVDENGKPKAGEVIRFEGEQTKTVATGTAGADGTFSVKLAKGDNFKISRKDGNSWQPLKSVKTPNEPGEITINFKLTLSAESGVASSGTTLKPNEKEAVLVTIVTDLKEKPRPREIVVYESLTNQKRYKGVSDAQGRFELLVPRGDKYRVKFKVMNEWNDNKIIEVAKDIDIFTMTVSYDYELADSYTLDNVYFDTDKATLRPESAKELDELAEVMQVRPKLRIRIEGHTDNVGSDAHNLTLSKNRAAAVRDYLIKKGIAPARLESEGYGETRPRATNDTPEGRQKNRRTEAIILGGWYE